MTPPPNRRPPDDHDRGLQFDVRTLITRRRALQLAALGGIAVVAGCGSDALEALDTTGATETSGATTAAGAGATGAVEEIPEETAGPFPADGSNGPNVLTESGIVRRDITGSFGASSGVAEGVPTTVEMTIVDVAGGTGPVAGAAVYLWHCDRDGGYSIYSPEVAGENYLRGVQEADADGRLSFLTIWPGAYPGRWPHIHFEVYPTLDEATRAGSRLATSQIALPEDACREVYATAGYEASAGLLSQMSLETDNVFADGFSAQLGRASGSTDAMTVALNVGV